MFPRRDQYEVLREFFDDATSGFTSEQQVSWLTDLFSDHVGRLIGAMHSLDRPLDDSFYESDFIVNLHLVSDFLEQVIKSTNLTETVAGIWQSVADHIDKITTHRKDELIDELAVVFEEARSQIVDELSLNN